MLIHIDFFFRWFPLVLLLIFVVFLPLGWGSVTYILVSEIVPTSVRTEVAVLCNSWEQLLQFGVLQLHSVVCGKYGPQYLHWGFALTSAMGAIFVWIFVPETSGKTLEEIETFFTHLRSVHVFAEKFQLSTCTNQHVTNQIYSLESFTDKCFVQSIFGFWFLVNFGNEVTKIKRY